MGFRKGGSSALLLSLASLLLCLGPANPIVLNNSQDGCFDRDCLQFPSLLVIDQFSHGGAVKWPVNLQRNLTWCLDPGGLTLWGENEEQNELRDRLYWATQMAMATWEDACDVNFVYSHEGADCMFEKRVWFSVSVSRNLRGDAVANAPLMPLMRRVFPNLDPKASETQPWTMFSSAGISPRLRPATYRMARVDVHYDFLKSAAYDLLVGLLIHEIGHTLGFRHEHVLWSDSQTCSEDTDSIMVLQPPTALETLSTELRKADQATQNSTAMAVELDEEALSDIGVRDDVSDDVGDERSAGDVNSVMAYRWCGGNRTLPMTLSDGDRAGAVGLYGYPSPQAQEVGRATRSGVLSPTVQFFEQNHAMSFKVLGNSFISMVYRFQVHPVPEKVQVKSAPGSNPCWIMRHSPNRLCPFFGLEPTQDSWGGKSSCPAPQDAMSSSDWVLMLDDPSVTTPALKAVFETGCDCTGPGSLCDCSFNRYSIRMSVDGSKRHLEAYALVCGKGEYTKVVHVYDNDYNEIPLGNGGDGVPVRDFVVEVYSNLLYPDQPPLQDGGGEASKESEVVVEIRLSHATIMSSFEATALAMANATHTFQSPIGGVLTWVKLQLSNDECDNALGERLSAQVAGNVHSLILSSNHLSSFPSVRIANSFSHARTVQVQNNEISLLHPWIGKMSNIVELNTRRNKLSELPEEIFGLKMLRVIDFSWNNFTSIDLNRFKAFSQLSELSLEGNPIEALGMKSNSSFSSLRVLHIGQSQVNAVGGIVCEMVVLEELRVPHSQVTDISPCVGALKMLKVLDLSYNRISVVPSILSQMTNLEVLKLENNLMQQLPQNIFKDMSKLTTLSLGRNLFRSLPPLPSPSSLTHLEVSGNKLETVPLLEGVSSTLRALDVSDNLISTLPDTADMTRLVSVRLSKNRLSSLPPTLSDRSLSYLDLAHNQITSLDDFPPNSTLMRTLVEVDLSHNQLTSCSSLKHLKKVTSLLLMHNKLRSITDCVVRWPSLMVLDVSYNQLLELPKIFHGWSSLKILDASWNNITAAPWNPEEAKTISIETINLSHNEMRTAPNFPFHSHHIDFSHNRIEVTYGLSVYHHEYNYRYVDLSFNRIKRVPLHDILSGSRYIQVLKLNNNRVGDLGTLAVMVDAANRKTRMIMDGGMDGGVGERNVAPMMLMQQDVAVGKAVSRTGDSHSRRSHGSRRSVRSETPKVRIPHYESRALKSGDMHFLTVPDDRKLYRLNLRDEGDPDARIFEESRTFAVQQLSRTLPRRKKILSTAKKDARFSEYVRRVGPFNRQKGFSYILIPRRRFKDGYRLSTSLRVLDIRNNYGVATIEAYARFNEFRYYLQTLPKLEYIFGDQATLMLKWRRNYMRLQQVIGFVHEEQILKGALTLKGRGHTGTIPIWMFTFRGVKFVDLSFNSYKSFPSEVLTESDLETLDVTQNKLTSIPGWVFLLPSLKILKAHGNRLTTLPPVDGSATNLTELHLSSNHLRSLPQEIMTFKRLTFLDISSNTIGSLPPLCQVETLFVAMNRLHTIDLSCNKGLQFLNAERNPIVHAKTPKPAPNLRYLDLSWTSVNTLDDCDTMHLVKFLAAHAGLESLPLFNSSIIRQIEVSSNGISSVTTLHNSSKLEHLDLEKNSIEHISEGTFDKSVRLQLLVLEGNNLRTLPTLEHCRKLYRLRVSNNRLTELPRLPPSIDSVYAYNNELNHLEGIGDLPRLINLDVAGNRIENITIPPLALRVLAEFNRLKSVDLSRTEMYRTASLELGLANNQLATMPWKPLHHRQYVFRADDNPFEPDLIRQSPWLKVDTSALKTPMVQSIDSMRALAGEPFLLVPSTVELDATVRGFAVTAGGGGEGGGEGVGWRVIDVLFRGFPSSTIPSSSSSSDAHSDRPDATTLPAPSEPLALSYCRSGWHYSANISFRRGRFALISCRTYNLPATTALYVVHQKPCVLSRAKSEVDESIASAPIQPLNGLKCVVEDWQRRYHSSDGSRLVHGKCFYDLPSTTGSAGSAGERVVVGEGLFFVTYPLRPYRLVVEPPQARGYLVGYDFIHYELHRTQCSCVEGSVSVRWNNPFTLASLPFCL